MKELMNDVFEEMKNPAKDFSIYDKNDNESIRIDYVGSNSDEATIVAISIYNEWFDDFVPVDIESDDPAIKRLLGEVKESLYVELEKPIDPEWEPDPTGEK